MSKLLLFLSMLIVLSAACTHQKDVSMSFDKNTEIKQGHPKSRDEQGWFVPNGQASVDTVTLYNNQLSVRISNAPQDTTKISQLYYWINTCRTEGQSVRFSGKFKYRGTDSTSITFGIQQLEANIGPVNTLIEIEKRPGDSEWTDFAVDTILSPKAEGLFFFAYTAGDIELWLSDCQAYIDDKPIDQLAYQPLPAENDNEFDKGSQINLPDPTSLMYENLEVLGKVWGFIKYYHPAVTRGEKNWDYELFRILPQVVQAPDKESRNSLLNKWVDGIGKIGESDPYRIEDPKQYSRMINLNWINDSNLFDQKLIAKLNQIKNAKRSMKFNYYYIPYLSGFEQPKREKPYSHIRWEDQGFRILALFKFYNAMEYCFPYREMTDKPWHSILKEFLPKFVRTDNKVSYELTIHELIASINDSHGAVIINTPVLAQAAYKKDLTPNTPPTTLVLSNNGEITPSADGKKADQRAQEESDILASAALSRKFAPHIIPVTLTASQSGDIVVKETHTTELERGDIIRSVDGKLVDQIIQELKPYVPASNEAVLLRNVLPWILRSYSNSIQVACIRKGKEINLKLTNFGQNRYSLPRQLSQVKYVEDYHLTDKGILFINAASVQSEMISDIMNKGKEAKGIILDIRKNLGTDTFYTLAPYLYPTSQEFMWFSVNEIHAPGNYKSIRPYICGIDNPDYFKGKVAILVDEGTQSHGEFSSIALRKAPRSAVIGSTTAGADGNISYLYLPGNIKIIFTALGAYYPNWGICQRKGVHIDIEARPTNEEIRNGQDVWIEKAIRYILE